MANMTFDFFKVDEVLQLMTDYINEKTGFEYYEQTSDVPISGRERYENNKELSEILLNIENRLSELGYIIYDYE